MKKLSTYLFLILFSFSAPSFADDISDFQIEGISIGDSLLDYMSEQNIKTEIKNTRYMYTDLNEDFGEVYLYKELQTYDYMSFFVKPNDEKFLKMQKNQKNLIRVVMILRERALKKKLYLLLIQGMKFKLFVLIGKKI